MASLLATAILYPINNISKTKTGRGYSHDSQYLLKQNGVYISQSVSLKS